MRLQKFIMPGVFLLFAVFHFFFGNPLSMALNIGLAGGYFFYWLADRLFFRETERRREALRAESFKKNVLPIVREMFGDPSVGAIVSAGGLFGELSKIAEAVSRGEPTPGCDCERCKALRAKKSGSDKRW